jgi:hypothetical protein
MKKIIFSFLLSVFMTVTMQSFAQDSIKAPAATMDTLITKKNTTIVCKITKITETEIEYKKVAAADAPVYVVSKEKIKEIHWANGTKEKVTADEMALNKELDIIDKRSAVKFQFFSPLNDQLTICYERSLKVGTNIEFSAGLINNSMLKTTINGANQRLTQGGLFKVGVKFLLGQDYYMSGMKYTHPLKGRFFKPELAFSSFTVRGVRGYKYYNGNMPHYYSNYIAYSDRNITSVAALINYGRQFILGNVITFSYSVGVGYTFMSSKYSNPEFNSSSFGPNNNNTGYYAEEKEYPTNMYTHLRTGNIPLAFTGTITLGYIFK